MKQSPNLLCTFIDTNGTLLSCNQLFLEAFGFSSHHSLTGKNLYEILHAWEVEKIIRAIDSCKANPGQTISIEIKKSSSNAETHFRWTIYAGNNADGLTGIHLVGKNIDKEKQAEKDGLHQATLLEYINDAVISTDTCFIIKSWNKAAERLHGINAAEAIGKPLSEMVCYEYLESGRESAKALLLNEDQWKGCVRYTKRNDDSLFLESCVTSIKNEANEVKGYVAVNRDITASKELEKAESVKKQTEQKLQQSQRLFEHFMGNAPLAAWIADGDGTLHYMSPEFRRRYGFTPGDTENSSTPNLFELFPASIAQACHESDKQVIESGKAIEMMEKIRFPDGTERVYKIYKFPIHLNGLSMVGGWATDMTEQMELQERLTKSIERYEYVNNATSDAIYEWNLESGKIFKGKKFESLFHHPSGSTEVRYDLIHPEDRMRVAKIVEDSISNPEVDKWQIEYRYQVEGRYRNVISKSSIIRENGKAVRVIGAVQDITEHKMLQLKLVEQEKNATKKIVRSIIETQEKEKRQLFEELHDNVNQMLASIKLMLEMAQENKEIAPVLRERSYQCLQTVITEIVKISHDLNPFSIEEIGITEAIAGMVGRINLSGRLKVIFDDDHFIHYPFRPADKAAVYRIVQEQLNNIVKHARAEHAVIRISSSNTKIYMTIEDDGIGFNPEGMKRGLGLKNIYHRVEFHNGKMRIESKPGAGCRMKILLNMECK